MDKYYIKSYNYINYYYYYYYHYRIILTYAKLRSRIGSISNSHLVGHGFKSRSKNQLSSRIFYGSSHTSFRSNRKCKLKEHSIEQSHSEILLRVFNFAQSHSSVTTGITATQWNTDMAAAQCPTKDERCTRFGTCTFTRQDVWDRQNEMNKERSSK
jgi:hypothetical protein